MADNPPPDDRLPDDRLFEEALDFIIRMKEDPANPVTRELIEAWRARSPAHEAAWAEVAEIHGMAARVLGQRRRAPRRVSRRGVVLGGLAGAVALGGGALFGPRLLLRARADHATATAELRQVVLADGSRVTLGPDSAIRSAFTPAARRVELLAGMAFFEVAEQENVPFQASVEGVTATALGTAFDLSYEAESVSLSVERGRVAAALPGLDTEELAAGEWLTLNSRTLALERGSRPPQQIAAWRTGLLVAERETIDAVVERIARWQSGWVIVEDSAFGARRISGVFDLKNPLAALEAVVHPHGGRVRQISPWVTLISPL